MNALEKSIKLAIDKQGETQLANKAYLEFIKANFLVPIEKNNETEEPKVLFFQDNGQTFFPVFSNRNYFDAWAGEIREEIAILTLSGVDLLKGLGDNIMVCLNIGSSVYKEFNPSETARMKGMVLKLFK